MADRQTAIIRATGEWLLEVSALLVVFPLLDQIVDRQRRSLDVSIVIGAGAFALTVLLAGLVLKTEG